MTRHYCTLTDRNYLAKAIVLYESLMAHSSDDFVLHLLSMDSQTHRLLDDMELPNVRLMSLAGFEHAMNMEPVKASRSRVEYLWTCASALLEYLLPWMDSDGLTYLDADLFFLADPAPMFSEMGDRSLAIVPHRLIPSKKHLEVNGKFNVGWLTIRNTETGKRCIKRWAWQVRQWCYDRIEGDNACGDQKFLDEWPDLYGQDCCIIENIGANLAPWNLANYTLSERDGSVYADDTPALFFHAHEFKDSMRLTNYVLREMDMLIYRRYIQAWIEAGTRIEAKEAQAQLEIAALERQWERA